MWLRFAGKAILDLSVPQLVAAGTVEGETLRPVIWRGHHVRIVANSA
jgi:hypothetical protein